MQKVIIIGGGIGGLTLARACLDVGISVAVYEKRLLPERLSGPGGIFIQRNAMQVYKLLWGGQIYDRLYQQGGTILKGGFFSKQGKPLYINSPEFVQAENLGVCLLRPELQQILYEALPEGTVQAGCIFENFEERGDTVRVSLRDGSTTEGRVLVGADGLYSSIPACRLVCRVKIAWRLPFTVGRAAGGGISRGLGYRWTIATLGQNFGERAIALATLMSAQVSSPSTPLPIQKLVVLMKRKEAH
jgi:hypothetical protein